MQVSEPVRQVAEGGSGVERWRDLGGNMVYYWCGVGEKRLGVGAWPGRFFFMEERRNECDG